MRCHKSKIKHENVQDKKKLSFAKQNPYQAESAKTQSNEDLNTMIFKSQTVLGLSPNS